MTKDAPGDRYDDFAKHVKNVDFLGENMSRISALDPTEKHVQRIVQVVYYRKKHALNDQRCSGGGLRTKTQIV